MYVRKSRGIQEFQVKYPNGEVHSVHKSRRQANQVLKGGMLSRRAEEPESLAQLSYNALPLHEKRRYNAEANEGLRPKMDSEQIFYKKMDELFRINYRYYHQYKKPFPGWSERQGFKDLLAYAERRGIDPVELAEMPERDDFVRKYYQSSTRTCIASGI